MKWCMNFVSQAEPALMYDSVHVFAIGLQTLEQSHSLTLANVSCDAELPWDGGLSLINYINSVSLISKSLSYILRITQNCTWPLWFLAMRYVSDVNIIDQSEHWQFYLYVNIFLQVSRNSYKIYVFSYRDRLFRSQILLHN